MKNMFNCFIDENNKTKLQLKLYLDIFECRVSPKLKESKTYATDLQFQTLRPKVILLLTNTTMHIT